MSWYRLPLEGGDTQLVIAGVRILGGEIIEASREVGRSTRDLAIFLKQEGAATTLYFSPALCERTPVIKDRYKAEPCDPPSPGALTLLVGSDAWELLSGGSAS